MIAGEALVDRRDPAPVQRGEIVHHGIVWDVAKESFSLPLAGELTREFVAHPGAVAVVALDETETDLVAEGADLPVAVLANRGRIVAVDLTRARQERESESD